MREKNRKPIANNRKKLPQFTTMNVIDGQADLVNYSSLIFYSLTIDNILNIIVLLILAGVSIAMLTGENGILNQAAKAKNETEKAQANEALILEEYNKFLNNAVGGTGSTTPPEEEGITAGDIAGDTNAIGKEVTGYEAEGVTEWKIFYAGTVEGETEPHIYLISSDYIPYDVIPNSTNSSGEATSNKPNKGSSSYPRAAYLSNILNDYAGSSRVTDSRIKGLNNSYFNVKNYSSVYENMKSVAYMLDINAWNKFAVSGKADYAIGGPTVELLFRSYNQKYPGTNYVAEATSATGYKVGSGSASSWSLTLSNASDPLYVITSTSNAAAYWLASPSAINGNGVFYVDCNRHCGL